MLSASSWDNTTPSADDTPVCHGRQEKAVATDGDRSIEVQTGIQVLDARAHQLSELSRRADGTTVPSPAARSQAIVRPGRFITATPIAINAPQYNGPFACGIAVAPR